MSPALVTMFLFQFVAIWNNFFLPLVMLSNTNLYPVTLGLYSWDNQYGQAPQLVSYVVIGSLISVIPLVVAFLSLCNVSGVRASPPAVSKRSRAMGTWGPLL
jgi:multiple sugar transport system permease protein